MREFKNGARYLYDPLGQLMAERLMQSNVQADLIVYVPSDKYKEKHVRGFNPAKLLAYRVSELTNIPVSDTLIKFDVAKANKKSDKYERETNILDAFEIKDSSGIQGSSVVLVDDILTTGSTADEASRVLKMNGAKSVTVLCFACTTGSALYDMD